MSDLTHVAMLALVVLIALVVAGFVLLMYLWISAPSG